MTHLSHIYFSGVEKSDLRRTGSRPVAVHRVLRSPRIAPAAVMSKLSTPPHPEFDAFLGWILQQAGIEERGYRISSMYRRMSACLRKLRVSTTADAKALLEQKPELLPVALDTLLIGVSDFFRDANVFQRIENEVIPELLRNRGGVRVCSAGASCGQELYSMAMLISEAGALETSDFVGIDVRPEALRLATKGCFTTDQISGIHLQRRGRFLLPDGANWTVHGTIRERMTWQCRDLFSLDQNATFDLILFRNVAIYFDWNSATSVWEKLVTMLSPGGFLITGKAEKPPRSLPLTAVGSCIYQAR